MTGSRRIAGQAVGSGELAAVPGVRIARYGQGEEIPIHYLLSSVSKCPRKTASTEACLNLSSHATEYLIEKHFALLMTNGIHWVKLMVMLSQD